MKEKSKNFRIDLRKNEFTIEYCWIIELINRKLLSFFTSTAINVADAKPTVNSWEEKDSSFCQLDLFKDNPMKSMPFASFSQDAKRIRITRNKPKSFKITSTPNTKCCWQIKKWV